MMNKLLLVLFLADLACAECICLHPKKIIHIKDTIVDCFDLKIDYTEPNGCCGGLGVAFSPPRKRDCKSLGRKDAALPVKFDSTKVIKRKETNEKYFFLNGKVQEKDIMSKDSIVRTKEIFVFDTIMRDTSYRVYLWTSYIKDSIVDRRPKIDTILLKR